MNPNNKQQNEDLRDEQVREAIIKINKIAAVLIAVAIVAACFAFTKVSSEVVQMIIYWISTGLCVMASVLFVISISVKKAQKSRHNFFLYDPKKKIEVDVKDLSFDTARQRTCEFMSIFKRRGKLYVGDLLGESSTVPEHFKPLFCYELLYELAIDDGIDTELFLSLGGECASVFAKYLRQNEDYDLANNIYSFLVDFEKGNLRTAEFKEYIGSKGNHIQEKTMKYIADNIEKFN